jgi:hypothetical protein
VVALFYLEAIIVPLLEMGIAFIGKGEAWKLCPQKCQG